MRPAFGFLLIVFLLCVKIAFAQGEGNSVLKKTISLEAQQQSVASILEMISAKAKVYFSYDPSLIDADKKIDASFTGKRIQEILDIVLEGKFTYRVLDNQVVITLPDQAQGAMDSPDAMEDVSRTIVFRGKVVDKEEREILPYSSIVVRGANLSTISNTDGNFELKIPGTLIRDTVVVSCMGYMQFRMPVREIGNEPLTVYLQPGSFQIQEIKVVYLSPEEILRRMQSKVYLNYPAKPEVMTSFYREVLKQDHEYIDVAEAVMDIRKSAYDDLLAEDKVKFIKGRKSLNVKPFQFVDFKIQGGPYYITRLDVVKSLETFLDPEYAQFYKYNVDEVIDYDNRSTYVISFKPKEKAEDVFYQGKLYIDRASFALVKADFELSRQGLKYARESLIQKKPKDFWVRPVSVVYMVNYRRGDSHWHLSNARASIHFKVKSKKDNINSAFHSVSELLVTDFKPDEGSRFKRSELFSSRDIFTDMIPNNEDNFWADYNTILPSEDLRKALKTFDMGNDTLFNISATDQNDIPQGTDE